MANTRPVVTNVSLRLGQVTLVISALTSRTNFAGWKATFVKSLADRRSYLEGPISRVAAQKLAGVEGLEPPASGFGDRRSSQLSYTPTVGRHFLHGIGRDEGGRKDVRAFLSSLYAQRAGRFGSESLCRFGVAAWPNRDSDPALNRHEGIADGFDRNAHEQPLGHAGVSPDCAT